MLEARQLLLPETAWWREDFIAELTSFPAGAHDDWCDALAMALNYLRNADNGAQKWILVYKLQMGARTTTPRAYRSQPLRRASGCR